MKKALTVGVMVIIVAIGGVLFYRSTEPNGDKGDELVTEEETKFEEEKDGNSLFNGSQFLQMEPDVAAPSEILDDDSSPQPLVNKGMDVVVGEEEVKDSESVSDIIVSMTDLGFVPASVTVKTGAEVTFVNDGQALHWPASDVHPTHDLLSGFDAGRGLNTAESYSFVFKQKGTWGFHDHLFSDLKGEVIVE
jgi:plastocyanin